MQLPNHLKLITSNINKCIERNIFFTSIYLPIILNFQERSYISYDEGFYALQARWILEKGNWLAPMWWSNPVYDRTIGVQWLIAISQSLFGDSIWAAHLPSIVAGILTLYLTFEISKILIGNKFSWVSTLILSSTYLWVDYLHLATQDMPLLSLELLGIYSLLRLENHTSSIWYLIAGLWVGPAVLLKSFMVLLPMIALFPYIYISKQQLLRSRLFYLGLAIGFIPLVIWSILSINAFGLDDFLLLYRKLTDLSNSQIFKKSFAYYFWNIPANTFPWSVFNLIGIFTSFRSRDFNTKYMLVFYPIILLLMLSSFNTKTPYYALQLTPFIAINANLGLQSLFMLNSKYKIFIRNCFCLLGVLILFFVALNLHFSFIALPNNININLFSLVLLSLSIPWITTFFLYEQRKLLLTFLIGPYLAFSLLVQSGLFTDRSPSFREEIRSSKLDLLLEENRVNFVFSKTLDNDAHSKLIRLALNTPNIANRLDSLTQLQPGSYAWIQNFEQSSINLNEYKVLSKSQIFAPWILIYSIK